MTQETETNGSPIIGPFTELKSILATGSLQRQKHWRQFNRTVRLARQSPQNDEIIRTLDQIDRLFYDNWQVPKLSIGVGTILFIFLTIAIEAAYWLLLLNVSDIYIAIVFYGLFSFASLNTSHVVFHWLIGRPLGIKFRSYFIFQSAIRKSGFRPLKILARFPTPGIKYQLGSFLNATRWKRTIMLISAPILTGVWFVINYGLLIAYFGFEEQILQLVGLLTFLGLLGNLFPSYLWGDLRKARLDY